MSIKPPSASAAPTSADIVSRPPAPDDVPARIGPYEIIEELGRGGMGRVYAARQAGLGRIVALKVLAAAPGAPPELELRFLREARTAAALRHANIVAIHDAGRAGGYVYFSMDYVEGGDLARRLRARSFAPREAAALLAKVAAAVAAAHEAGVLHRDLKPSNILLDGDEPLLADFGLAAQIEAGGDLTSLSGVLGTPHYLAPEAFKGGSAALTTASDVYALGVILFELLTGRTPYAGASPAELALLLATTEVPSPKLLAPAVSRELELICMKCLEREPARRYPSVASLADDLQRSRDGRPVSARPVPWYARLGRWSRRRPALAAVWGLTFLLALLALLAAVVVERERRRTEQALDHAQAAEVTARERLRAARVAEARALRRTSLPGRRKQALDALTEAARIAPGADLRDEAVAAEMLSDVEVVSSWDPHTDRPSEVSYGSVGGAIAMAGRSPSAETLEAPQLWHWGEAEPYAALALGGSAPLGPLRFSADGKALLMRCRDNTVRVWRASDATLLHAHPVSTPPGGEVLTETFNDDADFTVDGTRVVSGCAGGGLSCWQIADGVEVSKASVDGYPFTTVRCSPDGRHVAATRVNRYDERHVYLYELPNLTSPTLFSVAGPPDEIAWSSDGSILLVATEDGGLEQLNVQEGALRARTRSTLAGTDGVTMIAGDSLAMVRGSGTVFQIVDLRLGNETLRIDGAGPSPLPSRALGDEFMTAGFDNRMTRWRVREPCGFRVIPPPFTANLDLSGGACGIAFASDAGWVASAHGRYLLVRDTHTGGLLAWSDAGDGRPMEWGTVAVGAGDHCLYHQSSFSGLARIPVARDASGKWALGTPEPLDTEPGFIITAYGTGGDPLVLLDPEKGIVKVLRPAPDGRTREASRWQADGAYAAALSPDATTVLVNFTALDPKAPERHLQLRRTSDGGLVQELTGPVSCEVSWAGSGDVALTSDGQHRSILWDTRTWRPRANLDGALGGDVTTFTLSPDGAWGVIARDAMVNLIDAHDGHRIASWEAPAVTGLAACVRFLPDGQRFAVLWRDGRIDIYDPPALRTALKPIGLSW